MPRALLSVSDKTGIVDLGRGLAARGFELVSTGGTARALADAGLAVTNVSDLTGFPEMMDGRVKTLHPALHGGILARRDRPDDLAALARHGIGLVDVVVVNLYPFAKAAANPATPFEALVEEIDIGGPSLVRAAAKNFRDVLVVVDPADYPRLLAALDRTPTLAFRFELMRKAFAHTAEYDTTIATTLLQTNVDGDRVERAHSPDDSHFRPTIELADRVNLTLEKMRDLRYGENPHQKAAWYRDADPAAPASARWTSCRARSCRSRISSISTPRPASRWNSTSPPPWSSSTRTRAARRSASRRRTPTSARARPTASPRSAASSPSTDRSTSRRPRRSCRRSSRR